ncbi:MAG: hypothetical protein EBU29_10655, partial [Gammaproteobacteria bacterium]|nr:hypothetical protein [Gammaproteobacteria bacterium]
MAQDRVGRSTKFAFGIGQMAEGIKNNAFSTFLLLYYNQVLGLSGTLSGLAIMIALCFDAITDPLAGSLSDGWRSRWGRRHPFMYASVTILWSALGTHDQIPRLKAVAARETPEPGQGTLLRVFLQVFLDLKSALTNRSFRWLFSGVIIVYVMVGVQSALGLYMGNYFWALSSEDFRWVVLAGPLGLILGTPFTHRMNQRFDKMPSVVFGTAWYALFALSPPILRLLGWFPANGDPSLLPLLVGAALIGGMGVVQALITAGSMMADIADEHELATRRRQEGIFFGALSFSGKGASGIGNLV